MSEDKHNPIYGDPFDVLIAHFEAHDIHYSCNREERRAWFTMNSGSALQKCSFRFDKTGDVLQILIQYPVMVKEKFRPAAMEFITRANYGLVIGNFEMDCNDGEVRYHVSHLMEDGRLEDETIQRLFGTGMGTADRYFPALMRVLFAGETPSEAVDLAELHKFEGEDRPSKKAPAAKAPGTPSSPKKPRAKRPRKAPPATPPAHSSKPQDEHAVPDAPTQDTPPPTPPAPQAEGQDSRSGLEGEEGDRKAA
jgi:hypothetical protein